jgi:energy-converting hydrogenase Eha subunit E
MTRVSELDPALEESFLKVHTIRAHRKKPALLKKWEAEEVMEQSWFIRWARSQVAAYRIGMVLMYLAIIYFGGTSFSFGVPLWEIAAPIGWSKIWAAVVMVGGLVAAIGATRAGDEPLTQTIRVFNRVELVGAVLLFLALSSYSMSLLYYGYLLHDDARATVGSGFFALGIHPAARMTWLLLRPRQSAKKPPGGPKNV